MNTSEPFSPHARLLHIPRDLPRPDALEPAVALPQDHASRRQGHWPSSLPIALSKPPPTLSIHCATPPPSLSSKRKPLPLPQRTARFPFPHSSSLHLNATQEVSRHCHHCRLALSPNSRTALPQTTIACAPSSLKVTQSYPRSPSQSRAGWKLALVFFLPCKDDH